MAFPVSICIPPEFAADGACVQDWWNATTIEGYWRSWNMPVHRWMVRHIYFPIIRAGLSRGVAMTVVFFLSAVFHEVSATPATEPRFLGRLAHDSLWGSS